MRYAIASVAALSATACMSAEPDFNAIELACKGSAAYDRCIQFHIEDHRARHAQMQERLFLMGQALQGAAAPPAPSSALQPIEPMSFSGHLESQWVSGSVRTCAYRVGPNVVYQSLQHTQLCPLTYP